MKRHWLRLCVALFCASALAEPNTAAAEELSPAERRARAAINWRLPHEFATALSDAKEQTRILVIKGVSFGIDDAGAQCATKGKW